MAFAFVFSTAGVAAAASPPPVTSAGRAEAIAKPSIVYISVRWSGYVYIPPNDRGWDEGWYGATTNKPLTADTSCSGFVASPEGHVVTAGHCVDDQSMTVGGKAAITEAAVAQAVQEGITESQASDLRNLLETFGKVESEESGSPPQRTVSVFQTVAASGVAMTQPMQANVLEFRTGSGGDVAVLKVQPAGPMPALEVASQSPDTGTQLVAMGYPGSVARATDPKLQPSFKEGTTSGGQTVNGVPFVEISAAVSPGMSGGPVVDMAGRVLGTVSWGPSEETQAFNFIADTSTVRALLSRNGVPARLSATDKTYRAGLSNYFTGHYHAAVEEFDKVLAVQSNHAQAQYYRGKAVASYPLEKKSPLLPIGIGVTLTALVLGLLLLVRRRRAHTKGVPTAPPAPASQPPTAAYEAATPASAAPAGAAPASTMAVSLSGEETAASEEPVIPSQPSPIDARMLCPNCAAPHPREAHFCASCGQPFASAILKEETS